MSPIDVWLKGLDLGVSAKWIMVQLPGQGMNLFCPLLNPTTRSGQAHGRHSFVEWWWDQPGPGDEETSPLPWNHWGSSSATDLLEVLPVGSPNWVTDPFSKGRMVLDVRVRVHYLPLELLLLFLSSCTCVLQWLECVGNKGQVIVGSVHFPSLPTVPTPSWGPGPAAAIWAKADLLSQAFGLVYRTPSRDFLLAVKIPTDIRICIVQRESNHLKA